MEAGLLLLRVVLGLTMAAHGTQKAFGWFGGHGMSGTSAWLGSMGFRPGRLQANALVLAEFGGGLCMAVGLLTPFAAAGIIGVMVVAIVTVHWVNGFFNTPGGFEFNLLIATAAAALAFTGPGPVSMDNALGWTPSGVRWGLIAIAIGVLAGVIVVRTRRTEAVEEETTESGRIAA
jgi:putative oxidoreductase